MIPLTSIRYKTVHTQRQHLRVKPVLEYASPVRHASLTVDQTKTLEAVQQRACQVTTGGGEYTENCVLLRLGNLAHRRDWE